MVNFIKEDIFSFVYLIMNFANENLDFNLMIKIDNKILEGGKKWDSD